MNSRNYVLLLIMLVMTIVSVSCSSDLDQFEGYDNEKQMASNPYLIPLSEAISNGDAMFNLVYNSKNTRSKRGIKDLSILKLDKMTRSANSDDNGYYIVNYENDGGFALLSADSRRTLVLALSDVGNLFASDTISNKGLSWYLNDYLPNYENVQRIIPGLNPGNPKDTTIQGPVVIENRKEIYSAPLLQGFMSQFHQNAPYNKYCFTNRMEQSVVGCVPLAVGTILAYNKYPSKIENYTFDWNAMYQQQYHDSWSRLFEVIGRPNYLDVTYYKDSAGIDMELYDNYVEYALNRLGYTNFRLDSSENYLIDNLKYSHPVLVCGTRTFTGSHAWVIDGGYMHIYVESSGGVLSISNTNYYNCVWGWAGDDNGYYSISKEAIEGFKGLHICTGIYK